MNHSKPDNPKSFALKSYAIRVRETAPGVVHLAISGRLGLNTLRAFTEEFGRIALRAGPARRIETDLSEIDYLDSSAGLALLQFQQRAREKSVQLEYTAMKTPVRRIMDLLVREGFPARLASAGIKPPISALRVRSELRIAARELVNFISFTGEVAAAAVYSLSHPRMIRWEDLFYNLKRVGVEGLPIVGMINFLLGFILAFMSSIQLKQFGAHIYVASLVAIASVRELSPVMTAIIVAGRSGSAFAAEIGTMQVNEEVSALVTMGFDINRFLVVPKLFAALIVLPVLTLYADLFSITGGMLVGTVGLHLTPGTYLEQTQASIFVFDIVSSLIKALFFAAAIAIVGCQRGFLARGGAQSVGALTTSAVVSAISSIIVIDSIFAIVLQYIGPATFNR